MTPYVDIQTEVSVCFFHRKRRRRTGGINLTLGVIGRGSLLRRMDLSGWWGMYNLSRRGWRSYQTSVVRF